MVRSINSKRKNKNFVSKSKCKKTKKITNLSHPKIQKGGFPENLRLRDVLAHSARGSSAGGQKINYVQKYEKYRGDLFIDLANEGELLDKFNTEINQTNFCETEDQDEDNVACFFRTPMLVQKLGEKQEGLFQKIKKRKLNSELMIVLNSIRNSQPEYSSLPPDYFERQEQYSLARRLTVVVDLMAYQGDIKCKFAKLLIDRLRILENIIDLSKMTIVIQELKTQRITSTQDYEFYYGQTDRHIEYQGTNYELIPTLQKGITDLDTMDKFIVERANPRDIFITDYDYPCLSDASIMKKKMPLYRSSGTNFSSKQKGMLSPFQGKALKKVGPDDLVHNEDCEFRYVLIDVVDILFPDVFKDNNAGYRPDGSIGRKLLYTIEEWDSIFSYDDTIFSYAWFIKFSPFVVYEGRGKISKIDEPAYDGWGNCDLVYNMLGAEYIGLELQRGKMEVGEDYLMIKNLEEGLKTMELSGDTLSAEDIESSRSLFYNRFFASEDLFSMRHKGNFSYTTKLLTDFELNKAVGSENIFNKDLAQEGLNLGVDEADRERNVKRKVACYLYDALYHHAPDDPPKNSMSDIEKVFFLSESKFLSYEIIKFNDYYRIQPYHILGNIIGVLLKVAEHILNFVAGSDRYQDTIFYDFIKLPFYEDINNPTQ